MEVGRQINEIMTARVILGLALFLAGIAFRLTDPDSVSLPLLLVAVLFVVANIPFLYLSRRGSNGLVSVLMVIVDTLLITAAVVLTGGVLSSMAIFYLWPIVSASLLLPHWTTYLTALACAVIYMGIWAFQASDLLVNDSTILGPKFPKNWFAQTVGIRIAAFLLIALLTGMLGRALVDSNDSLRQAKLRAEGQLTQMRLVNEQLRSIEDTSQVFLAHHDVESLMPEALAKLLRLMRFSTGFALVRNDATGDDTLAATVGDDHARADRQAQGAGHRLDPQHRRAARLRHRRRRGDGAHPLGHPQGGLQRPHRRAARLEGPLPRPARPPDAATRGDPRLEAVGAGAALQPARRRPAQHPVHRGAGAQERRAHAPRPAQERLHGHHEPRAAHAAHLGHRLQRHAPLRRHRRAQREAEASSSRASSRTASTCST